MSAYTKKLIGIKQTELNAKGVYQVAIFFLRFVKLIARNGE